MRQVVVIHGGHVFGSYDEYIAHLRNYKIEGLEHLTKRRWKDALQDGLGGGYEVIQPRMPSRENAKYLEWKIWFEKLIPYLSDGVILVGHSLGAKFLAKYLSEEEFPKKITATILVAAPFWRSTREHADFILADSLELFQKQGGKIVLYHSKDDKVVSFSELAKYQAALPAATVRVFDDRDHFNQESFPELLSDIKIL